MFILICDECHKKEDIGILDYGLCDNCKDKEHIDSLKEAIKNIYSNKLWEKKDTFVGFKSDNDKEYFMKGIKYGIEDALFWIADHFGEIDFIELVLEWKDKKCKKSDVDRSNI